MDSVICRSTDKRCVQMTILMQIFLGSILLGICSFIHIALMVLGIKVLRRVSNPEAPEPGRFRALNLLLIGFSVVLVAHTVQVWIWALSFVWMETLPNLHDAIYFSLVTYTTVGYGDVTLDVGHRIFGAMASITGLLNFGLSTAFLVGLFERVLSTRLPPPPPK